MPSMNSLLKLLKKDFISFKFHASDTFYWSYDSQTISYDKNSGDTAQLLHELSHGVLGHQHYQRDIELMTMEREAWIYASTVLGPKYHVVIDQSRIEVYLDSYRDWLHERSTCPECTATGIEVKKHLYECAACGTQWRVNDARRGRLKRQLLK